MQKIILGFVGLLGSGKGTAAVMLKEKYGAEIHVFSDILKDILRRLGLPISRENLQGLSTSLRTQFGQDLLAKAMAQQVGSAAASLIVIDGIRR
ncbi:MAG: AAA family ATPase, partial [Patescibacteria group bacterium]